jgi:hypothetical protein
MERPGKRSKEKAMQKYLALIVLGIVVVAASWLNADMKQVAAQTSTPTAVYDSQGRLKLPTDYRKWVFVGAPLTPNGLNGGNTGFPEYHHVYIQEKNVDAYLKNGVFPEGTVIIKELTRVLNPTFPDGSTTEPSGRGFFNGEFNGIDCTVKDSKKFAETNGWGFFTFGHHPEPYEGYAAESPVTDCAGCHMGNAAKTDMTWIQFYPMLLNKELKPRVSNGQS